MLSEQTDDDVKRCVTCKLQKPESAFCKSRQTRDGLHRTCKICDNARHTRRHQNDPERTWRANLKRNYGLTPEAYWKMFHSQGGCCRLCRKPETQVDNRRGILIKLAVDHCHRTMKNRGLLCSDCNRGVGMFHDRPHVALSAFLYLLEATGNEALQGLGRLWETAEPNAACGNGTPGS